METHFAQAIRDGFAVRSDERVYYFDPFMRDIELENRKGWLKTGYYVTKRSDGISVRHNVVIKIYNKIFFSQNQVLFNEFQTNIHYMQTLGDNVHVLGCIEALQDQNHYFVVLPFCDGGDLLQEMPFQPQHLTAEMEAPKAEILRKLLESLDSIHSNGICHGNIKPEHFLKLGDRFVLTNFGKARPGTPMGDWPLDLDAQVSFDADLRTCVKLFFHVLTGVPLYQDCLLDYRFEFFISYQGLSENPETHHLRESLFLACNSTMQETLWICLQIIRSFTPALRALIANSFSFDPHQRLTVRDILNSEWMRGFENHNQDIQLVADGLVDAHELGELNEFLNGP